MDYDIKNDFSKNETHLHIGKMLGKLNEKNELEMVFHFGLWQMANLLFVAFETK